VRPSEIKLLWGRAAARCAFPDCASGDLTRELPRTGPFALAEMAHVIPRRPHGPRGRGCPGDATYGNLILLCPTHHREVDRAPDDYPARRLLAWKRRHEARVASLDAQARPPAIWDVGHPMNPRLVGREPELEALARRWERHPVQVLHGMAGVGKTQIAVHYARRFAEEYATVALLDAGDDVRLLSSARRLLSLLGVDAATDESALVAAVRTWLEEHTEWLLIFDRAVSPTAVADLVPAQPRGHVLVTTLSPSWRRVGATRRVPALSVAAAGRYLRTRTGSREAETARALAAELGRLPIALEQCAAYVEHAGCSLQHYATLFAAAPARMLAAGPVPADYDATVSRTLFLAMQSIDDEQRARALALLRLLAVLDASPVDRHLLLQIARQADIEDLPHDEVELDETVGALATRGLLDVSPEAVAVHSVVQAVVRDRMDRATTHAVVKAAAAAVLDALPWEAQRAETFPTYRLLLPHAVAVAERAADGRIVTVSTLRLADRTATHLWTQGQVREPDALWARALADADSSPGIPDRLRFGLNLNYGLFLRDRDPRAARDWLTATLDRFGEEPVGERDHDLHVADALHNLALAHWDLDELDDAEARLRLAIQTYRRADPEEEWASRGALVDAAINSGLLHRARGNIAAAIDETESALALLLRARRPDGVQQARTLSNLGVFYEERDEPAKARVLHEAALRMRTALLGEEHPDTALSVLNLGGALRKLANKHEDRALYEEALRHHRRVVELAEATGGKDHLDVASALNNVGLDLDGLGRAEEAVAAHRRALKVRRARLPETHSAVLQSSNNLGRALLATGDLDAAERNFRTVLHAWRRSELVAHHPQVAIAYDGLGRVASGRGDRRTACTYFRAAYDAYRTALGDGAETTRSALRKVDEACGKAQR
jgi:tetratricopeptide (TPR) repeat protein